MTRLCIIYPGYLTTSYSIVVKLTLVQVQFTLLTGLLSAYIKGLLVGYTSYPINPTTTLPSINKQLVVVY